MSLWCKDCGGARAYVMEHMTQRPIPKACMCARWFPCSVDARHRFKSNTDSNFYQLLEDGRVVACEPFAPHVFKPKRRKAG